MILTGDEIKKQVRQRNIDICPFGSEQVNPNSYNYRLGNQLVVFDFKRGKKIIQKIQIPKEGYVLEPHKVYLANTYEVLGSKKYAMSLIGRSSLGRLGLFLQVSANLGHTGSSHKWTLELVAAKKIKIYPFMTVGQISFWDNKGEVSLYNKGYSMYNSPRISRLEKEYNK